jgi:hypothetical protein
MTDEDVSLVLNREAAYDAVQAIDDPIVRNAVELALAAATARFIRWSDRSPGEGRPSRPAAPFDLLFLVQVLEEVFSDRESLRRLLSGKEIDDLAFEE